MAIDGVFLHFLLEECKQNIIHQKINRFLMVSEYDFLLVLPQNKKVLFSFHPEHPHFRFTADDYLVTTTYESNLFLKKQLEGSVIWDFTQQGNDRIFTLHLQQADELGYPFNQYLIFEFTGRKTNLILTDENHIIKYCWKKSALDEERLLQPKLPYPFLDSGKQNPFLNADNLDSNSYEGVSSQLFAEGVFQNSLKKVLKQAILPTITIQNEKIAFHVFPLTHLEGRQIHFQTIQSLLDYYFTVLKKEELLSNEQKQFQNHIQKERIKLTNKQLKQERELLLAHENLKYEQTANILAANIHLVKKYQTEITVWDFYNNKEITIPLQPEMSPSSNLESIYHKYKKAKRTIDSLQIQIKQTKMDIAYINLLAEQAAMASKEDMKEILQETGLQKKKIQKGKPNILSFSDQENNTIFVGKNNVQNEYITHKLALPTDYFFHVKDYPGSHVVFRGVLTEEAIVHCAQLAAHFSKAKGKVSVDYTLIKWVKKVKGQKGSFVTYTHQKSVLVDYNEAIFDIYKVIKK
ncbi:MAG: NFACT family protein [Bacilli bacterium]|jgi:predicted ribosome quality control (RQC) complex YloA/Tae2 family protein|nr:NFACT family protein [Bacilli bacterium]